jgi:toxin ParE1/3/4
MRVLWTEEAERRLEEIESHVAADNPAAAIALVERILSRASALAGFPEMGRRVPEIGVESVRELVEGNYRIVYRLDAKRIEVITVFEGHRLLRNHEIERAKKGRRRR